MVTNLTKNNLTVETINKTLEWGYEKALNGLPGTDNIFELAEEYLSENPTVDKAIDSLIRWQNTKAATSGFLTGLGGLITLPVAIPANIASVLYVQIRMIGAIAHMRGYDLKNDKVKTFIFACLAGQATFDIFKGVGIRIGEKLTEQAIKKISGEVIKKINQTVGFRLVTKFGEKGIVNLGKAIPLVGGVIGATVDGMGTNSIGEISKKVFIENPEGDLAACLVN